MWDYRIVKHENFNDEFPLSIREVYYQEDGTPFMVGMTPECIEEDTVENVMDTLNSMMKALSKPILNYKDIQYEPKEEDK